MEKTKIPGKISKRRGGFASDSGSDPSDLKTRALQKSQRTKNDEIVTEISATQVEASESLESIDNDRAPAKAGSSFAGVDAKTYAKTRNIPEDRIWQMVLSESLQGRTFQGKLFILQDHEESREKNESSAQLPQVPGHEALANTHSSPSKGSLPQALKTHSPRIVGASKSANPPLKPTATTTASPSVLPSSGDSFPFVVSANAGLQPGIQELPPIPIDSRGANALSDTFSGEGQEHFLEYVERKVSMKSTPAVTPNQGARPSAVARSGESTEFSLLLDHMRVMQTEQQHLMALTRQAIEKITEQAEQMIHAKDELLHARRQDAERLTAESASLRQQLQAAKQEIEDLQMLNDVLQS